jgi:RNA polymerase sigma factor (sigma-70 family)
VADADGRFSEIYEAYSELIYTYALRRAGDPDTANDIVAETFLVAWRKMGDVPDGDQARPWLYAVARRVLSTHHRGHRRRQRLQAVLQDERRGSVVLPADAAGDLDLVGGAFSKLSASDRELLTLVGWDGLCMHDLAIVVGCSRATARVRLHRARRRFDRELAAVGLQRPTAGGHERGRWAPVHPDLEEA